MSWTNASSTNGGAIKEINNRIVVFSVGFLEFNEKRKEKEKINMWYQAIQGEVEVQKKEKRQQRGMSFKISTTLFRELLYVFPKQRPIGTNKRQLSQNVRRVDVAFHYF